MHSVREIIFEAAVRCNVGRRRQALPGGIEETALKLLHGVVDKYNYDNLLNWTQNSVLCRNNYLIHLWDEEDTLAGEGNLYFNSEADLMAHTPDDGEYAIVIGDNSKFWTESEGQWVENLVQGIPEQRVQQMQRYASMVHMNVKNIGKINSIYVVTPNNTSYREHAQLRFVSPTDFDRYSNGSAVYTTTQKSDGEWLIEIKPIVAAQNWNLKICYNEMIEFDIDSDLYIPENYVELLIVALAHKLALMYPRLDDAQMQRLENEVRVMVDNVRTPKAADRVIARSSYEYGCGDRQMTQQELIAGQGIFY
jgi:hypothetical protein